MSRSTVEPDLFKTLLRAAAIFAPLVPASNDTPVVPTPEDLRKRLRLFESKLVSFATWFDSEPHDEDDVVVRGPNAGNAAKDEMDRLMDDVAQRTLWLLEQIQSGLVLDLSRSTPTPPNEARRGKGKEVAQRKPLDLGTKDLQHIRSLLALVFHRLGALLNDRLRIGFQPRPPAQPSSSPTALRFYPPQDPLIRLMFRIYGLIYSTAAPDSHAPLKPAQTHITATILNRHATALLVPSVVLGWAPPGCFPGEGLQGAEDQERIQSLTVRLLQTIPISQGLASLGVIMTTSFGGRHVPEHAKASCKTLMSTQVIRPGGALALMDIVFGERGLDGDVPLHKLEKVATTLSSVPSKMSLESYYSIMVPRLLEIIAPTAPQPQGNSTPSSHLRAAAFSLSRMLRMHRGATLRLLLPAIHSPFVPWETNPPPPVHAAVTLLTGLFANSDPAPTLFHQLLSPIMGPLFSLYIFLHSSKLADPLMKEQLEGLIKGWARIVGVDEAIEVWWCVITLYKGWGWDEHWEWAMGADGPVMRRESSSPALMLDPSKMSASDNPFNLHPDPSIVVDMLKTLGRKEVSADLFVRCLDEYSKLHEEDANPLETMLFLQMVLQMAENLGPTILEKPEHVLSFVNHALETEVTSSRKPSSDKPNGHDERSRFRIVPEEDSDDEDTAQASGSDDEDQPNEMVITAVTLLLSVLEANTTLTTASTPLLNSIYTYLDPLTNHPSESLRQLAKEARLVLIARRASAVPVAPVDDIASARRKANDTYQEALQLIQDPILPVRAHGLMLLRQLVAPATKKGPPALDPALVPAILDIFLQSVQDDESYVYLNAVKGLAAMVDGIGPSIFKGLVDIYVKHIDTDMEQAEMDKRLRIGEALVQVVQRCGETLGMYIDMIAPPVYRLMSESRYPTILRASSLAVLAQCVATYPLALLPWYQDIASSLLDLIQIETVSAQSRTAPPNEPSDDNPTLADPKIPAFRRSASYLLTILVREAYDKNMDVLDKAFMARMRRVLGYAKATDADHMVRTKAMEALEILDLLVRNKLGI